MFDGQNLFHDAPSFSGGWHLHHAVQGLVHEGADAPIVVALDHGGSSRLDELSPFSTGDCQGRAEDTLRWLERRLMPKIERRFPVRRGPEHTAIGGSSMGGLASLYIHFRRPNRFGAVMALSPSLWFADRAFLGWLDQKARLAPHSRVYLDGGIREGKGTVERDNSALEQKLRARGYGDDRLRVVRDPNGKHTEACWRYRVADALRFVFSPRAHAEHRLTA
jgi:enterochelin esterase-like enzyme